MEILVILCIVIFYACIIIACIQAITVCILKIDCKCIDIIKRSWHRCRYKSAQILPVVAAFETNLPIDYTVKSVTVAKVYIV